MRSKPKMIMATVALHAVFAFAAATQSRGPELLVLEKSGNSLAIIDPNAAKIVARVPAGQDPHEVTASADGKLAFISNYGGSESTLHTISVVDLAGRKAIPPIDLGALRGAHGIEFAGGKVYFTAEVNKAIGRIDPSTSRVDWILGLGQDRTHMLNVSKTLDRIVTSNVNSDSISIIDKTSGPNGWAETVVAVGKGPEGFDVSPDGGEVWAANSHDGTVSVIDVATKKVSATLNVPTKFANRLKFTPDGKTVLVTDLGTGDLVVLNVQTREEIKRLKLGAGVAGILVVPDGSRAYVAVSTDNKIAVVDLKKLEVVGEIKTGGGPDGMAWVQ
jgi:YVTN family beta-propeller protein